MLLNITKDSELFANCERTQLDNRLKTVEL